MGIRFYSSFVEVGVPRLSRKDGRQHRTNHFPETLHTRTPLVFPGTVIYTLRTLTSVYTRGLSEQEMRGDYGNVDSESILTSENEREELI